MPKRKKEVIDEYDTGDEKRKTRKCDNPIKTINFCQSFKVPTRTDSCKAIGKIAENEFAYFSHQTDAFFESVPVPTSANDWLAHVSEPGQTYREFMNECPWISGRKVKLWKSQFCRSERTLLSRYPGSKIYVFLIRTSNIGCHLDLKKLTEFATLFLGIPVCLLTNAYLELPKTPDDNAIIDVTAMGNDHHGPNNRTSKRIQQKHRIVEYRMKEGHIQLNVVSLINILRNNIPSDALCLVGLTMEDLFEEPPDLFVAGLASGNERVAVFSFARYDPHLQFSSEHWFQISKRKKPGNKNNKSILKHSCKLLVHEICHLLGIDHCIWYRCCMNGSGHIREDFSQPMFLCPVDLRKLYTLTGFDVKERYRKLRDFYEINGYQEEARWIMKRLESIAMC